MLVVFGYFSLLDGLLMDEVCLVLYIGLLVAFTSVDCLTPIMCGLLE